MAMLRGMSAGLGALTASLGRLTVLWPAIPPVSGGQIAGVYLALLQLTAVAAFEVMQPLGLALQSLEASRAAAQRLFEILDAKPVVDDTPRPAVRPKNFSLDVRHLSFWYAPDEAPVLDDVSFTLPAEGRLVIVGPSGVGKSTLINILLRFWEYQTGSIMLGGHELREYRPDDVRGMTSVVAQEAYLFSGTVRANLLLANPDADDNQIVAACRKAQLDEFIQGRPQGYDTWIGENGFLLSGDERQRLAIARCILEDAPILILDEATAQLDAVTETAVLDALRQLTVGRTTVIVSHRVQRLEPTDHVFVLDGARIGRRPITSSATTGGLHEWTGQGMRSGAADSP